MNNEMKEAALLVKQDFDDVKEAGRQEQYDEFWDDFQQNGSRTNYQYAFYRWGNAIQPKYDIKPQANAQNMFFNLRFSGDLKQRFADCGIVFDTSKATNLAYLFQGSYNITAIPTIDISSAANATSLLYNCPMLETAEIIGIKETHTFGSCFLQDYELQNLTLSGTIGQDINLQWSTKLSVESLISLFRCLKDFTNTDPDNADTKTITLSAESLELTQTQEFVDAFDGISGIGVCSRLGWLYE